MKILLDRLTESPTCYRFEADPGWWGQAQTILPELAQASPGSFEFEVAAHRMGADIYLEGLICGELALGCSRCLARYRQPLRESFRLILEPPANGFQRIPRRRQPSCGTGCASSMSSRRDGFAGGESTSGRSSWSG